MPTSYYKRNCPVCGKELSYKSLISFKFAEKNNKSCIRCCDRKNTISSELIDKILELNSNGILNREIARILNIHHRTVGDYLKKYNKKSLFANQPIDLVSDKEARCRLCKVIKSIDEFQWGRKGQKYEYKFSYCNKCRKKQVYLNLNSDVNKFLSDRFNRLRLRAKKLNIPLSITKEEFIDQYHKQKGLCFYTDTIMICEVGSDLHKDSLSIDKIIPEKGYCKGNVVFSINKVNTCKNDLTLDEIKQWMPYWYNRICNFIGTIYYD